MLIDTKYKYIEANAKKKVEERNTQVAIRKVIKKKELEKEKFINSVNTGYIFDAEKI